MNAPLTHAPEAAPDAPDADLVQALDTWQQRLNGAGLACRGVAFHGPEPRWCRAFADPSRTLAETWSTLRKRVVADNPVALGKTDNGANADLLLATRVPLPGGQTGVVGACLAPPHHERSIQQVLLALGWLQLALSAASLAHNQRAAQLLELMGYVSAQEGARAGAQEWVNRTAAFLRQAAPEIGTGLSLTLFEVRRDTPHWWVAADTTWAERAAPAVQQAAEPATRAIVETQEVREGPWWALPLLDDGEPVAVLVARSDTPLPPPALDLLRASAGLAEPLLRHWRESRRSLPRHVWQSLRDVGRKLSGPGHLTWKAGAALAVLAAVGLLAWPLPDRVTADTVIEGRTRQVVTAPQEGFIAEVLVRPGERVTRGQLLARLDDRDIQLEKQRFASEAEQAAGRLRQAMAERDAPAMALAATELQSAQAQGALAEARLQRTLLLAPLDGLVVTGDWAQQLGSPVEPGKELFEIAAGDGYRVVLHVPDAQIARVLVGQRGELRLTGRPQEAYAFELTRLTATASVQDGVNGFRVEAAWLGDTPALSPGMQGVGKIEVGRANLLTQWTRPTLDWLRLQLWRWIG
ncbi:MAG: HlyD family efflux transporter periplasmic adaptor subunit [Rubrivivax sp.]|nr:HlyD family efflux transporter periplasmic adaptor subunit [Rubrivivax sp.]